MNEKLNDEKLTAYVLGELDAKEAAAVERALAGDEAARLAVAELRAVARLAGDALQGEAREVLSETQRAEIAARAAAGKPATIARIPVRRTWLWTAAKLAAMVVIVTGIAALLVTPDLMRSRMQSSDESRLSPGAREAKRLAANLPEKERDALRRITDINGPASPAVPLTDKDYENPAVQQAIAAQTGTPQRYLQEVNVVAAAKPERGKVLEGKAEIRIVKSGDEYYGKGLYADAKSAPAPQQDIDSEIVVIEQRTRLPASAQPLSAPSSFEQMLNDPKQVYWPGHNTEAYDNIVDNPFLEVVQNPLSTFSIDVDTASYSNIRRFLNLQTLPPKDAVRIEEMVNYFDYAYAPPPGADPFAAHIEVAGCPWAPDHRLVRVGIKGKVLAAAERPATNLVFLLDVSGSMEPENKLPLLKQAMKLLVNQLGEKDKVAIVVYAGASGLVLPATNGDNHAAILDAIDRLGAGGSTNGGEGIQLAYRTAIDNFVKGGVNRVILATDGDFNVGVTSQGELVRAIEAKAKSGVFLTVLGFGMGNVKDATLERLADKGNGNYAYIDTLNEAKKVLVDQIQGTLVTIAKDVKIQVEFNPAQVKAYRLIGYENRLLAKEDFNDDTKDAGEIGAGHTVTALYELVPAGGMIATPSVDALKYQQTPALGDRPASGELLTLKMRYKQPDGDTSQLLEFPVHDGGQTYAAATTDYKFAAAVAGFGMLLRDSRYKGNLSLDAVLELAQEGKGADRSGFRQEFMDLVKKAKAIGVGVPPPDMPRPE